MVRYHVIPARNIIVSMTLGALLAGCAAIPKLGTAPAPRSAASVASSRTFAAATATEWPGDGWWTAYGDPQLAALIEQGLRDSPDLAAASARFRRATAMRQRERGALLPSLDVTGNGGLVKQSYNTGFPKEFVPQGWLETGRLDAGLRLDIDLWGRNRAALAAATSEARATQIDAWQARLMLTTGIAEAYADLARLEDMRDIQQRALDLRTDTQRLVADRLRNGLDTQGDMSQAEASRATAAAQLAAAEEAITLRRHQIAALIGAGPDAALDIKRPALTALAPHALPADVTTDLIGRRPDIAAARDRAEAAADRIKVARADFFPAIRLDAMIGVQALGYNTVFTGPGVSGPSPVLDTLFTGNSVAGSVGPAISLPIFHGGALRGRYRGARASYDEAVANYDRTVLDAYRETADVVTSRAMLGRRLDEARVALKSSEQAYTVARLRYTGGLSTFLDTVVVEERLLSARQLVAELEARAFTLDVSLVRALGGGFLAPTKTTSTPSPKEKPHG